MTSIVYRIGACGTGLDNIAVNEPRHRAKRGDGLRIAARNGGYETTISFNYLDCVNSDGSTLSRLHVRVARAAHTERPGNRRTREMSSTDVALAEVQSYWRSPNART